MQGHREPHRFLGRSYAVEGGNGTGTQEQRLNTASGDPSPLVRIAVALEGLRTECRRIADSVEVCSPATTAQVAERDGHDSLTDEILLADPERSRPPSRSPYLGAVEAAEYLGVTVSSLYGVVERGHLIPLRGPRRSYRFTEKMLDDYLKRRK